MTMLMVVSAPAMANDWDWNNGHNNDNHDFFIDNFDDDFDNFDDDFEDEDVDDFFDDCVFIGFDGDEALYVCELDV